MDDMKQKKAKNHKGRKFWLTVWTLAIPFVACTIALWVGKMSGETYVSFLQFTIPLALAVHHGANVAEKVMVKTDVTQAP